MKQRKGKPSHYTPFQPTSPHAGQDNFTHFNTKTPHTIINWPIFYGLTTALASQIDPTVGYAPVKTLIMDQASLPGQKTINQFINNG